MPEAIPSSGELGARVFGGIDLLYQPEIEHFHEVVVNPFAGGKDVGWLHVAVDQPMLVGIGEGVAGLGE